MDATTTTTTTTKLIGNHSNYHNCYPIKSSNCQLETFEFESNQEGIGLKHLKVLDLSKNKLHLINLVEYENLEDVELSNNELKTFQ